MILDVLIIGNFFQYQAQNILKRLLFIRRHIAPNLFIPFIESPLKARVNLSTLVHGEGDRIHLQINRKLIGLFLAIFSVFEMDKVVALPFNEADEAFCESTLRKRVT